ncbi:MAG: glutamine amidotransferase [Phycisphaeraceae bacterium]|nr:MAG: glutamine amidotransferase [Phycisphaeraceae bacterium]
MPMVAGGAGIIATMATILVIQHMKSQGPGRLGATLRDHGFRLDIRTPSDPEGRPLPPDLDNVHGVVSLGGTQDCDESHDWLAREREILAEAHGRGLPVIGICLGHQILAQALGGEVAKMEEPEVGFVEVEMTHDGRNDTILSGVAWKSWQFQLHGSEVTKAPPGAAVLASSAGCKVQAFRAGHRTYGFQHHFEFDLEAIDGLIGSAGSEFEAAGVSAEEARAQLEAHGEMFSRLADRVCVNLATLAFNFDELTAV